jgi:hypothetical protein
MLTAVQSQTQERHVLPVYRSCSGSQSRSVKIASRGGRARSADLALGARAEREKTDRADPVGLGVG